MPEIRAASFTGPRIGPKCASRMWFPLSVRNGSPACLRNSTFAPRPSSAADAFFQPNGWTSTGNGVLVRRLGTRTPLPVEVHPSGWKNASAALELRVVDDHDELLRRRRDDFLAEQGAAHPLDQVELRVDFVGAIDGQVEPEALLQRGQRNPQLLRLLRRLE